MLNAYFEFLGEGIRPPIQAVKQFSASGTNNIQPQSTSSQPQAPHPATVQPNSIQFLQNPPQFQLHPFQFHPLVVSCFRNPFPSHNQTPVHMLNPQPIYEVPQTNPAIPGHLTPRIDPILNQVQVHGGPNSEDDLEEIDSGRPPHHNQYQHPNNPQTYIPPRLQNQDGASNL